MPDLQVKDITLRFGGVRALNEVSFTVPEGELVALVGPNGAGKSSLFNCISRLYKPTSGSIHYGEHSLLDTPVHRIAKLGIARTFQNLSFAPELTLLENVMLADSVNAGLDPVGSMLRLPWSRRRERDLRARALEMLGNFHLDQHAYASASSLSFGTLKRAEIARALLLGPTLLLVDEPVGGLNAAEIDQLGEELRRVRTHTGASILLVEHNMGFIMSLADRLVVLDGGKKIAEGAPTVVAQDPAVIEAYTGVPL